MHKRYKIWTVITPICWAVLKEQKEKTGMSMTRQVMDIIYNKMPMEPYEDFTYTTKNRKAMVITVNEKEKEFIKKLAEKHGRKVSRYLREVIYTHLKDNNLI